LLRLHFLNVRQGDSTIVEYDNGNKKAFGIIDSNRTPNSDSPGLAKLLELGAKELSFVCMTHPDKDHYSGLYDVLEHYSGRIGDFYTCPLVGLTANKARLKKLAKQHRKLLSTQDDNEVTARSLEFIKILKFASEQFLPHNWHELTGYHNQIAPEGFADLKMFCLLPPAKAKGSFFKQIINETSEIEGDVANNDISIAIRISYQGSDIILGGDGSKKNWFDHRRWQRKAEESIASNIVKLPHHGSKRDCDLDTRENLFRSTKDCIGIFSADGKRHPDAEVVDWLIESGGKPYCTNLQSRWASQIHSLYNDDQTDLVLKKWINEAGSQDLAHVQPCKGDITVSIDRNGSIQVDTEHQFQCPCDPTIGGIFPFS